jgi:hypothetical protein
MRRRILSWLITASFMWFAMCLLMFAGSLATHIMPAWLAWTLVTVIAGPVSYTMAKLTYRIKQQLS